MTKINRPCLFTSLARSITFFALLIAFTVSSNAASISNQLLGTYILKSSISDVNGFIYAPEVGFYAAHMRSNGLLSITSASLKKLLASAKLGTALVPVISRATPTSFHLTVTGSTFVEGVQLDNIVAIGTVKLRNRTIQGALNITGDVSGIPVAGTMNVVLRKK